MWVDYWAACVDLRKRQCQSLFSIWSLLEFGPPHCNKLLQTYAIIIHSIVVYSSVRSFAAKWSKHMIIFGSRVSSSLVKFPYSADPFSEDRSTTDGAKLLFDLFLQAFVDLSLDVSNIFEDYKINNHCNAFNQTNATVFDCTYSFSRFPVPT